MSRARRIEIGPPTAADRDAFTAAMRASRRLHRPWIAMPETAEAYDAYLARAAGERVEAFLARRRDDGAIVGFVNLGEIIRGSLHGAFVGYGGVAGTTGQGYMTEALDLVLRAAFTRLRLHRLEANIQPGNTASIAMARRCGFRLEGYSPRYLKVGGRWRDHERWAITAEDWRAGRRRD